MIAGCIDVMAILARRNTDPILYPVIYVVDREDDWTVEGVGRKKIHL